MECVDAVFIFQVECIQTLLIYNILGQFGEASLLFMATANIDLND